MCLPSSFTNRRTHQGVPIIRLRLAHFAFVTTSRDFGRPPLSPAPGLRGRRLSEESKGQISSRPACRRAAATVLNACERMLELLAEDLSVTQIHELAFGIAVSNRHPCHARAARESPSLRLLSR